jgi:hypothetical protein
MELYKLENDTLKKYNGGFVVLNNRIYTNPTIEIPEILEIPAEEMTEE